MSAGILRSKPWLLAAALAAAGVLGPAASSTASTAPKLVLSDSVSWNSVWSPASGTFQTSKCKVKSDGETVAFPCANVGTFIPGSSSAEITSTTSSEDGTITIPPLVANLIASKPPIFTYSGTGPCEEFEFSDLPGTKEEVRYPCQVTVRVTFNQAKNTLTGTYSVKEFNNLP